MTDSILADIRHGLRVLIGNPRFSLLVVLILALGIGASTAVYSAVRSVILAPLPFGDSQRLARILMKSESDGHVRTVGVTPSFFEGLRERSQAIESSAAQMYLNLSLGGKQNAERLVGIGVSDQWLKTLGVRPILGRGFTPEEERAGRNSGVALVSWRVWQDRFGGREDVLGTVLTLNDRSHQVVGVMPADFRYPYRADLWTPMRFEPAPDEVGYLNVAARLRPGATFATLESDVRAVGDELAAERLGRRDITLTARPFANEFRRDPSHGIAVLLAAVALVLLLACVNVANLILVRSAARSRDYAIRAALGASRLRQVRQLLIESLMPSAAGGLLGFALASATVGHMAQLIPARLGEVIQGVKLDASAVLFAVLVSMLTALLVGLTPALRLTEAKPLDALKAGGRFGSLAGRSTMRWLVVTEVALAFVLTAGAGIVGRDFVRLSTVDVGYDPRDVMSVGLGLPESRYVDPAQRVQAVEAIVGSVRALPGVESAGITTLHPIPHTTSNTGARLVRSTAAVGDDIPVVNMRSVTASYLKTLGLGPLRGEAFAAGAHRGSAAVCVISRAAAERYWPGVEPVGQPVRFGDVQAPNPEWSTIVGVVADIAEPYDNIVGTVYRPYGQGTWDQAPGVWDTTAVTLLVRGAAGRRPALGALRQAIGSVDRDISIFDATSLEAALTEPLAGNRFGATVFVLFAAFALALAVLGTYGVLALSVQARIPEFGVRVALGLGPAGLLGLVVRYGMGLVGSGLLAGLALSLIVSRFLEPALTTISARDPATLAAVAGTLISAGLLSTLVPARRAMRIAPVEALREE